MVRYLLVILLCSCFFACSTSKSAQQVYILDVQVDRLDKIYTLFSDNSLKISNYKDLPTYVYANNRNGRITHVDVSNPLKVLVFFRDFSILKVLDNTLSEVSSISFNDLQYEDVSTAAASNDNNIWIYDKARYQLIKINEAGKELLSSINLTELRLNDINPVDIVESGNQVYLVDPEIGILVFDNFGQYIQLLPILGLGEVFVDRHVILYQKDKQIKGYDRKRFEDISIDLPTDIDSSYLKILPTPTQFVLQYRNRVGVVKR